MTMLEENLYSPKRTLEALKRRPGELTWVVLKHLEYLGYDFQPVTNNPDALKLVAFPDFPEDPTEAQIHKLFYKPGYQLFLNASKTDPGLYHARWKDYNYKSEGQRSEVKAHPIPGIWPEAEGPYVVGALSEPHKDEMGLIAAFCGLVAIGYRDNGKTEEYYFHKQGKVLVLKIGFNEDDGGFLIVQNIITGEGLPPDLAEL